MASYFNLTLDTTAPSGLTLQINDGALYATSTAVKLTIGVSDEQTTGYQMKIWGIDGVAEEESASWETFATSKSVNLTSGDGLKTVHIKVRDDVGNESAEVTDDITLNTTVPVVTVTGPDKSKISKIAGFNQSVINFTSDVEFDEYKVCVVPANSSEQDAGTLIPTTGGSINTSGNEGNYPATTNIQVTINGTDLESASTGDGVKIVKVFVKTAAGVWSVADWRRQSGQSLFPEKRSPPCLALIISLWRFSQIFPIRRLSVALRRLGRSTAWGRGR